MDMKFKPLAIVGLALVVVGLSMAVGLVSIPLSLVMVDEYYGWKGVVTNDSISLTKTLYYVPEHDLLCQSDIYKYMYPYSRVYTMTATFTAKLGTCNKSIAYNDWRGEVYLTNISNYKCIAEYGFSATWSNGTPVHAEFIDRNFTTVIGPQNILMKNEKPWFPLQVYIVSKTDGCEKCVYGESCVKYVDFIISPWWFKVRYELFTSPNATSTACYSAGYLVKEVQMFVWNIVAETNENQTTSETITGTVTVTVTPTTVTVIEPTTTTTNTVTKTYTTTITSIIMEQPENAINLEATKTNRVLGVVTAVAGALMLLISFRRTAVKL